MGIRKALRFDCVGVSHALKHAGLNSRDVIGRGLFSAVFDGGDGTVLKMTVDGFNHALFNNGAIAVEHMHFPTIVKDYGIVGKTRVRSKELSIFLYRMEKLEKLKPSSAAKKLAKKINTVSSTAMGIARTKYRDQEEYRTWRGLVEASRSADIPDSVREALDELGRFCSNMPGGTLDMHYGNLMQRANGELVIVDPICDMKVFNLLYPSGSLFG